MDVFFDVMKKAISGSGSKEYLSSVVDVFGLSECGDMSWSDEVDYVLNKFPDNGVEVERAELLRLADAKLATLDG